MAITAGITGVAQVATATEELMFQAGEGVPIPTAVRVTCVTAAIIVRYPKLHGAAGSNIGMEILAGDSAIFRDRPGFLDELYVVGNLGVVSWAPVEIDKH